MKGYVRNEGEQAYFVCQRQIPPGGKVELTAIYKSVGKKSGVDEGPEFVEWIKSNVFRRGSWGYYEEEGKLLGVKEEVKKPSSKPVSKPKKRTTAKTSSKKDNDAQGAGRNVRRDPTENESGEVTPSAIIEAPYDQARALIEKTKDRIVLRKALKLTNHFSGKEQHMRHIIKRLEQVY
jgi:hypothetical protein